MFIPIVAWTNADKKITIEVKSLNSKGLDLNLRIPSAYRELESELRKLLGEQLDRGKIDFGIYIESQADQSNGSCEGDQGPRR